MENIFRNNKLIASAFFTAFTVTSAITSRAESSKRNIPVELKVMGNIKNQLLFKLDFAGNEANNDFSILIKDEEGNTLFRENIKGEFFSKSFLLNTDEIGDEKLQVEVISRNSNESVVYEVGRTERITEEITVSEMK